MFVGSISTVCFSIILDFSSSDMAENFSGEAEFISSVIPLRPSSGTFSPGTSGTEYVGLTARISAAVKMKSTPKSPAALHSAE